MHPDLFIEEHYVTDLVERIKAREADSSLPKIFGKMEFTFKNSKTEKIPVEIVSYDEATSAFLLVNEELNVHCLRPRIYIEVDDDKDADFKAAIA